MFIWIKKGGWKKAVHCHYYTEKVKVKTKPNYRKERREVYVALIFGKR